MATGVLRLAKGLEWQDGAGYRLAKLPVPAQGKVGFTSLPISRMGIQFTNRVSKLALAKRPTDERLGCRLGRCEWRWVV